MSILGDLRRRLLARARLWRSIRIWYRREYEAACLRRTSRVPHLDLDRAERVLGALATEGLLSSRDVRAPRAASLAELQRVHPLAQLEKLSRAEGLARVFGLEPHDVDVDCVLMAQRFATGGTLEAARWASERTDRLAFNLGGGFHHAEPESASGFCLFNDVAIAVRHLRERGFRAPIAIVDLDFHQGNGNIVAFARDPTVLTFSIHGSSWSHAEAVADRQVLLDSGASDRDYLGALRGSLGPELERHQPRLVFYIAGNDVLAEDALGSFALTRRGVLERDCHVVELARSLGASVVGTMAGGYSPQAWQATASLLRWALTGEREVATVPEPVSGIRQQFTQVARSLDPMELQRQPDSLELDMSDVFEELTGGPLRSSRIFGYYSVAGVELALERYGLLDELRRKGFSDLRVEIDPRDAERQRLTVYGFKGGDFHLLVDLVARRVTARPPDATGDEPLDLLSIEWLLLQDPTAEFSLRRPKLPGQEHPGLGMIREVVEMLYQACLRLELDGMVNNPAHYHVAAVGAGHCYFLDPEVQGRFDALRAALGRLDLADASQLIDTGKVSAGGEPVSWEAASFVVPVSKRLRAYFESDDYQQARAKERGRMEALGITY